MSELEERLDGAMRALENNVKALHREREKVEILRYALAELSEAARDSGLGTALDKKALSGLKEALEEADRALKVTET